MRTLGVTRAACGAPRRGAARLDPGLSGSLPTELGRIAALSEVYLNKNRLTGSLPSELGNTRITSM